MAGTRRLIELSIKRTELRELESIARSRTEAAGRVARARVLLAYRQDPSFYAVGQALGMHHQKVRRYIERAKTDGAMAALDDRPRPGKEPTITVEAKTWVVALACRKPTEPGVHPTFTREFEYKRHGTVSLLAGIDLVTGKVHALVKDRHRSREFIEFLKLVDAAYPIHTAIRLILDNHSAHVSKETKAWLATRPAG